MSSFSFGGELARAVPGRRAAGGLRDRVGDLYLEAREDVYRYLLTLGLYPPQAQETTQEVFCRLYATMKSGEDLRNPRAWIFRVAHNLGLKTRARQKWEAPFDPCLEGQLRAQGLDPERSVLEEEKLGRFHRAVQGLSEQQRRCLFLRLEGLRYPEIGAALGISASAVGEFLRRAMARLKGQV